MSRKVEKKLGRPKGLPKTGGRQKGTPNKTNVRMRDRFADAGFDFVDEVISTLRAIQSPEVKADLLVKLTPFFMQRLREESETTPTPATDNQNLTEQDLSKIPTSQLLALLPKPNGPEGSN
jgi:hypothetical protein